LDDGIDETLVSDRNFEPFTVRKEPGPVAGFLEGSTLTPNYYFEHILALWCDADTLRRLAGKARPIVREEIMSDRSKQTMSAERTGRRQVIVGAAVAFSGLTMRPIGAWGSAEDGISHSAESIHQEPVFKVSRKRVYEALLTRSSSTRSLG
jgi:hypothetical protein